MELSYQFAAKHATVGIIKVANPAEVLTSSINSLNEQMRWRATLSR
jgi:hypothetical protein